MLHPTLKNTFPSIVLAIASILSSVGPVHASSSVPEAGIWNSNKAEISILRGLGYEEIDLLTPSGDAQNEPEDMYKPINSTDILVADLVGQ